MVEVTVDLVRRASRRPLDEAERHEELHRKVAGVARQRRAFPQRIHRSGLVTELELHHRRYRPPDREPLVRMAVRHQAIQLADLLARPLELPAIVRDVRHVDPTARLQVCVPRPPGDPLHPFVHLSGKLVPPDLVGGRPHIEQRRRRRHVVGEPLGILEQLGEQLVEALPLPVVDQAQKVLSPGRNARRSTLARRLPPRLCPASGSMAARLSKRSLRELRGEVSPDLGGLVGRPAPEQLRGRVGGPRERGRSEGPEKRAAEDPRRDFVRAKLHQRVDRRQTGGHVLGPPAGRLVDVPLGPQHHPSVALGPKGVRQFGVQKASHRPQRMPVLAVLRVDDPQPRLVLELLGEGPDVEIFPEGGDDLRSERRVEPRDGGRDLSLLVGQEIPRPRNRAVERAMSRARARTDDVVRRA